MKLVASTVYCTRCGQQGIPIQRRHNRQKEAFHLKTLYCVHCKGDYNHVQVRSPAEKECFMEQFKSGAYSQMVQESDSGEITSRWRSNVSKD